MTMKRTLIRLDQWLRKNRPVYYRNLNPGLSESEFENLEKQFGQPFPEQLKILYEWKNGQSKDEEESFWYYMDFQDLESVIMEWDWTIKNLYKPSEAPLLYGKNWLKILALGNDDGLCLDVDGELFLENELGESGQIVYFIHDTEELSIYYPDLNTMLKVITAQFEAGVYGHVKEDGSTIFQPIDLDLADKIESQVLEDQLD